jgi:uncharacterized protein (TIGR03437 family)
MIRDAVCKIVAVAVILAACPAQAAVTLTANPASLDFAYQVNDAVLPAAKTLTINSAGAATPPMVSVSATSAPAGWLTVTPDTGRTPLTLSVSVNTTGLAPGSYAGAITVSMAGGNPASVTVTLSVRNPPPTLSVTSTAANYTTPPPTLAFTYTTGGAGPVPPGSTINVLSSGDTIPFSVTASALGAASTVWARVNAANQLPALKTSGVALSGSSVPITITIDPVVLSTLNPGSYTGTVNVAANNSQNGSATINLTLAVAAGPPSLTSVFPASIVAAPAVNPTITIYGDNFFATSVVTIQQAGPGAPPPLMLTSTLLSRKVMRAVIPAGAVSAPGAFTISVTNPPPPSNPAQLPASVPFAVISATQPAISAIVNSASYLPTSTQTGTGANPVPNGGTSVSPREIITLFGQNLGPNPAVTATPAGVPPQFPTTVAGVSVNFQIPGIAAPVPAPLIVVSSNQINAIVPVEVSAAVATGAIVNVTVSNSGVTTPAFPIIAVPYDPGIFSFDGLGKGQGAVLNYDAASGAYLVNSSKDTAAKNSTIIIYATGMGDLADATIHNGEVAAAATTLIANTVRIDIDGQPAVVTYAGSTPGAVAGLVQINAIVPSTVRSGSAIPITVSVGTPASARRSQALVTIGVK